MSREHHDDDRNSDGFDLADHFVWSRYKRERLIRWVDIITYAVVFISGILTLIAPPESASRALTAPWVVGWAVLLIISGGTALVGRVSRYWVIEAPGTLAGAFGAAVYIVLLILNTVTGHGNGWVATTFVACMALLMVRRYVELQLFTTDPDDVSFTTRLLALTKRRTKDSIASGPN